VRLSLKVAWNLLETLNRITGDAHAVEVRMLPTHERTNVLARFSVVVVGNHLDPEDILWQRFALTEPGRSMDRTCEVAMCKCHLEVSRTFGGVFLHVDELVRDLASPRRCSRRFGYDAYVVGVEYTETQLLLYLAVTMGALYYSRRKLDDPQGLPDLGTLIVELSTSDDGSRRLFRYYEELGFRLVEGYRETMQQPLVQMIETSIERAMGLGARSRSRRS
jgi:hypothetical protein